MLHTFRTDNIHTIELFRFENHNFLELQVSIVPIKRMHMFCIENSLRFGSFFCTACDCRMQAFWYLLRIFFVPFIFWVPFSFSFSSFSFLFLCCPRIHCYDRKRISSIYYLPNAFRMCNVEFI